MSKIITAEIAKNTDVILETSGTFNLDKANVIIALAEEIAEDLGSPSANNILIDIANRVKYGSYQANKWEAHKDTTKICNKCGQEKSLYAFNDNCHYLDYKNKTCKSCLELDTSLRGDFEHKKLSEEIISIADIVLNQNQMDKSVETFARSARYDATTTATRCSPYRLRSLKNQLISKCKREGFDCTKHLDNKGL